MVLSADCSGRVPPGCGTPPADGRMAIAEMNALDRDPFVSRDELERKLAGVVTAATAAQQLTLIRSHPDLVGRAALAGTLGQASTAEQAAAGLDRDTLTEAEITAFAGLNQRYWQRFDFPFVICARDNKKAAILAGFQTRLGHDRDQEITTALREIGQIAHYRLRDLVRDDRNAGGEQ